MEFWARFWTIFFFVAIGIFALLSVVVVIGGFFDIIKMLKKLSAGEDSAEAGGDENSEPQAT